MENEQQRGYSENNTDDNNIINTVHRYVSHWKWFVISIVVTLLLAFVYVRYKTPKYEVSASILVKDDKKGAGLSELSAFEDLGLLSKSNNIDNEIEVLKSRSLMTLVAKELRLNVRYFVEKSPIDQERYTDTPVFLRFTDGDSTVYESSTELRVKIISPTEFKLEEKGESLGTFQFGKEVKTALGKIELIVLNKDEIASLKGSTIRIEVPPLEYVVDSYRRELKVDPVNKTSSVINISLKGPLRDKLEALVNNLIKQHSADVIADKNQVSKNTADFINERIRFITAELSTVESEVEEFKTKHKLVDVESEAKLFLESSSASELELLDASTQKALADYMYEYMVKHGKPEDLLPANLGLNDLAVSQQITEFNKVVLERNRILRSSSEKNPVVDNLTGQLQSMSESIKQALSNYKAALQIKIKELGRQEEGLTSRIATVPKYEKEYRMIQRQQQIKETLYLYLLQKREETNIALAVTVANTKVIDKAHGGSEPVSPKTKIIYFIAFLAGIVMPIVILYVIDLLDTKVHGKRDIDKIGVPFLGDIPQSISKERVVVAKGENSSVAEAFRLLRTNVDFMLSGKHGEKGKTVFVGSTLSKEGKSFIALNLASSIAISGKKVALLGLDIRAPKVLQYFNLPDTIGVTNFVSDKSVKLDDIIVRYPGNENLYLLPSGAIPPNPAELLMDPRIKDLFEQLKATFDYVIVDTAPIGMVTDTLLLTSYADAFIYVVRAYYLDRRLLNVAEDLYKSQRLSNMAILINGTDKEKGYGYGYGYGYGGYGYGHEKPRSLWKRMVGKKA
jgi:tyrosine-protein kinase Etk/Wzc